MILLIRGNASRAECGRVGQVYMPFVKSIAAGYVLFCVPKENQKGRRCPQGMKAPVGLLSRRPVCEANAACSARQGLRYFRGAGGDGLRLPASASCLERHSHPAGRGPNSSSLFPPQAAVVAVANQGLLAPSNPKEERLHTKNPSRFARGFFVFRRFEVAARRNVRSTACFIALRLFPQETSNSRCGLPLRPFP